MQYLLRFIITVLFASLLVGCHSRAIIGRGILIKQTRNVSAFNKININGHYRVDIRQGKKTALIIKSNPNLLNYILTKVEHKTLTISTTPDRILRPNKPQQVIIETPRLDHIIFSGANKGSITMLKANKLTLMVNGFAALHLSGHVLHLQINSNGSGTIDAKDLASNTAKLMSYGSGKIIVNAKDKLDVKISGSGKINYVGQPKIQKAVSFNGVVQPL